MNRLRIAVADDEPLTRQYFCEVVSALGHEVVCAVDNGNDLVEQCRQTQPDLVITDIKMPIMDGAAAMAGVCRDRPIPAVLVSAYRVPEVVEDEHLDCIYSYLFKPVKNQDIEPAINLAMSRFRQVEALRAELRDSQQQLVNRKKIERAKGILMRRAGIDEETAFRRLVGIAREKNIKVVELAETLILSEEAFKAEHR